MITTGVRAAVSQTFPITARRHVFFPGRPEDAGCKSPAPAARRSLAVMALTMLVAATVPAHEPRINYMLQCLGCHGPDGRGEPGHVPSIRSTLAPLSRFAAGRRYLVQVPGVALSM